MPRRPCVAAHADVLEMAKAGDVAGLEAALLDRVCGATDKFGSTAVHWAAGCGQVEALRYLIKGPPKLDPNIRQRSGNGRAPLHFASRNGRLGACRFLVEACGADADADADAGVTPFQLAAWQLQLEVMEYLYPHTALGRPNAFRCFASHWVALAPATRAAAEKATTTTTTGVAEERSRLVVVAEWLRAREGTAFWRLRNAQGHTPLHKAAFSGHLELCAWLRDACGALDDAPDDHGNFAADLALEAGHHDVAAWLRTRCAPSRDDDLKALGLDAVSADDPALVKAAFRAAALRTHADKGGSDHAFIKARAAYNRLVATDDCLENDGLCSNANPLRDPRALRRLLAAFDDDHHDARVPDDDDDARIFEARLAVILLEQPNGLPLPQLRKRFARTWPGAALPDLKANGCKSLVHLVQKLAPRVARVEYDAHLQVTLHSRLDKARLHRHLLTLPPQQLLQQQEEGTDDDKTRPSSSTNSSHRGGEEEEFRIQQHQVTTTF